ncbi:ABC transporter transmembrane region 2-domain-containing protein [Epithele typhae]|uniref:ABC transporter transmembrane region 2-domain-containing protein n=1 Tax=Epithele typhae TaxID=378194 RepID=UPI002008AB80|nr:ABC transporter transmembrane region 2-domain-containing protein [Epithele typhae]KAH9918757.1 ABC transporter transmembrane region 2-domain-containing protein [Epithele typhae]
MAIRLPSTAALNNLSPKSRRSLLVAFFTLLLLLRNRTLKLPGTLLSRLKRVASRNEITQEELAQALQQVYVDEPDGSKTLLVPYQGRISKFNITPTSDSTFAKNAKLFPLLPAGQKPNLDKAFLRQLFAILKIVFPSWCSKEALILASHSFFLVLRTVLSVAVARLDGRIVRDLIRHLQSTLCLKMGARLTHYTDDLYLSHSPDLRYYRVALEGGLSDVDQYITSDIHSFCEGLAQVYGNVLKPSLDLVLFTSQLSRSLGVRGTAMLFLNYYVTAKILRAVTPAFGRLAAVEARLEGEYRAGMGRVGRESEEVAFYGGGLRERSILMRAYMRLIKHVNSIYKIRIAYEWTEDFLIKYLWSAAGYCLISIPVFLTRVRSIGIQATGDPRAHGRVDNEVANRTETYISSRRLLLSLADAGGRLMYVYKDLLELAGLTTRLYTLLSTLHNLPRPVVPSDSPDTVAVRNVDVGVPTVAPAFAAAASDTAEDISVSPSETEDSGASKTANTVLVRGLSFELKTGEHLMITGSNGVGKTAVARVLAGLWAAQGGGDVSRPHGKRGVFVVPQRAYMVTGTLLDQIIYPDSYPQFVASGRTHDELMQILAAVNLAYLPAREGGWSTRKEWRDVLSGGEKQRMAMARVFYHRPRFAVLDECTSAVSSDVEGRMYEHAKSLGITLITISLRPTLMRYHTQLLTIAGDGTGRWTLKRIGTAEERMDMDREIVSLENRLAEVERWETRVKELERLLSVQEL